MITASLEVEHGIENLWSIELTGFKAASDYRHFVPKVFFKAFVCGFPHLWRLLLLSMRLFLAICRSIKLEVMGFAQDCVFVDG